MTARQRTYPVLLPREAALPRPVKRPRRTHPVARGLVVLALLGVPLVGHVWLQTQAAEDGYRLRTLRQEVARLEQEREQLRTQVAALRAPDRLERVALQLGLQPPTAQQLAAVPVQLSLATQPAAHPELAWWERFVRLLQGQAASAAEPDRP